MAPLSRAPVLLLLAAAAAVASARDVPANVRSFYDGIRQQKQCRRVLAGGFHSADGDAGNFEYCGDHLDDARVIYIQGHGGQLANMDIDCDGVQHGPADDGRCRSSDDTQSETSFKDIVQGYGTGQKDLDANAHAYVVFGNEGHKRGWPAFDPREYGVEPLSVMAVVCGDKLIYGVWGDTNGDDGSQAVVGEASISLATACFGTGINGNSGHDENDVLYLAFPGKDAVPGKDARWDARNFNDFERSITALGDRLIQRIGGRGGSPPGGNPPDRCSWQGHCQGARCKDENDCSDDLVCKKGKCAK